MSKEKSPYLNISVVLNMIALGQVDTVEGVLKESPGYDVNQKDKMGTFPALLAANQNNLRLLKLLVDHGARLDQQDGSGRTVMGWAKKHENQTMIAFIEKTLAAGSQKLPSKKTSAPGNSLSHNSTFSSGGTAGPTIKGH